MLKFTSPMIDAIRILDQPAPVVFVIQNSRIKRRGRSWVRRHGYFPAYNLNTLAV